MVTPYKCILVGDAAVGKTTWITRLQTGEFSKKYIATLGVGVKPLDFSTTTGDVVFNVWDCAGEREGYWTNADCAIVMYDCTSTITKESVPFWIQRVKEVCGPNIPIVVAANKVDLERCKFCLTKVKEADFQYSISARSCYNLEKPFLFLARKLQKDINLKFVMGPPITPPEVVVTEEALAEALRQEGIAAL